ncbi:MAG: M20/M25/M40 family metallo-hydrolase [Bacteroidales bacterium]
MRKVYLTCWLALATLLVTAQQFDFSDSARIRRLKNDIYVLAADSLLGREAGTKGEIKAMHFLAEEFQKIKLQPILPDDTYFQEFEFVDALTYEKGTSFKGKHNGFTLKEEYYPLAFSASSGIEAELIDLGYGLDTDDPQTNDYEGRQGLEGKIFLINLSVPGGAENYEDYADIADIRSRINTAEQYGARAVVFINDDPGLRDPEDKLSLRISPADIPVVFVNDKAKEKIRSMEGQQLELKVNIRRIRKKAFNVVGKINNNAEYTLLIGAHYDHLGMGGPTSRDTGAPEIHPGADDNASGVAGMLEIARKLKTQPDERFNYLFVAFSAEEKGLLGSSRFLDSNVYDYGKITAMLNLDMIGRMEEQDLHISGTGTSELWEKLVKQANSDNLVLTTSRSGTGASDHLSFYMQNIPVLFYFTGIHEDYHKPSDTPDKINYPGMLKVIRTVENLAGRIPNEEKLDFQKTGSSRSGRRPKQFSVTLGVVPDHSFDGEGFRIQHVIEDRAAEKAGLHDGDVIIQMGEHEIKDITSYMKSLSKFKKGNKTTVKIKRKNKILKKTVIFK